ncbi:MAG: hypothetical protein V1660_03700 [archaeon]
MIHYLKNKKALFFTISILFLLPAIITIWTISASDLKMSESFAVDRISDLSTSTKSGIRDIFNAYYSCKMIIEKDSRYLNVTIVDNISSRSDEWGEEFNSIVENYRDFVEAQEPHIKINLTGMQQKETPIVINPYNVTYSRAWGTGHVTLRVVPKEINFKSYDIEVNSTIVQIDNLSSQFRDTGTFTFSVIGVDNYGHREVKKANVDPADNHQVQIFFKGGNKVKIDLINNILEIWTNNPDNMIISTKIDNFNRTDSGMRVKLFENVLNVSFPELKAEKIDSVYITSGE